VRLSANPQEKQLRMGARSFMMTFLDCIGRSRTSHLLR
jgi:hypothetical protein